MSSTRIRYGIHQPVVNSYLVRERDRRRLRELALVMLAVAPLAVALLAYTWIHLEVLRLGYRIGEQERTLHALRQDERLLRLEASHLTSPRRIEERAVRELGMAPPRLDQMVFLTAADLAGGKRETPLAGPRIPPPVDLDAPVDAGEANPAIPGEAL